MLRNISTFLGFLVSLGLLAWAGLALLTGTTRGWFERDLELRTALAVDAARAGLVARWDEPDLLEKRLLDLTRDERIMAAAACTPDGTTHSSTEVFPTVLSCETLFSRRRADGELGSWARQIDLPSGPARVSLTPLLLSSGGEGAVALVHDTSYVERREKTARNILVAVFGFLVLGAAAITVISGKVARRDWTRDLRRALLGPASLAGDEFKPLLRDVRALAQTLAEERERDGKNARWSAERLRSTLTEHLHGERIVLLANREPYVHQFAAGTGAVEVLHPASGLVTALEPVMRACSGVWVAHGSGSADRSVVDSHDRVAVPPGEESYQIRRVWLTEEEENGYYYGLSNEGLWPLCHLADARPTFRAEDWENYVLVNQRFSDAVCDEVDVDDPIILVQDYHFALAPKMIRERLPRATILVFWHIPWPNAERIGICPWREELIAGLLGASILGFHTKQHCNNFTDSVDAFMETRIDREHQAIVQGGRRTLVRPYPISIEWPVRWLEHTPPVASCRETIRRELGLAPDCLLGVGVDRLDYTKGIEERLSAVDALLEDSPHLRGKFTFVQLAAPSRTKIARYQQLNDRVTALAAQINERWGDGAYRPIVLLRSHHEPAEVFRFYRACDLCYVSSLHDGMNLVAKEFVAAREDEEGVLILSEFTGAARDLTEAIVVNPYDIKQASAAMALALRMPVSEQKLRMKSMRRLVSEFNVYRWAGRMLVDAAELRRKERTFGRLAAVRP